MSRSNFSPRALLWLNLCVFVRQGDASKSGSEIDSFARSMEDVNGSKKDLSASAGEAQTDFTFLG